MLILCFSIDIWIIGSSISGSGMRLLDLIPKIQLLLYIRGNRRDIIIVHVGGNDIMPINELVRDYLKTLDALTTMLPGVKIGLSQILPGTAWRFSNNSMSNSRRRINSYIKISFLNATVFSSITRSHANTWLLTEYTSLHRETILLSAHSPKSSHKFFRQMLPMSVGPHTHNFIS